MKPLKLEWFRSDPCPQHVALGAGPCVHYIVNGEHWESYRADREARDKRFTDAELAAEMWLMYWGLMPFVKNGKANLRGKHERLRAIIRFATLPSYDEAEP